MAVCGQFAGSLRTEESAAEQPGLLANMSSYRKEIARIEALVEDMRAIRDRTREPRNQNNPRFQALSMAVSGLKKAADDMRNENAP
jgi:hypothetical protein